MKPSKRDTIPINELAGVIGVTPKTVRNRITRGVYTSPGRGFVSLSAELSLEIEASKADAAADLEAALAANWPAITAEQDALAVAAERKGVAHD